MYRYKLPIIFLLFSIACNNKKEEVLKPKTTPPSVVDVIIAGTKTLNNTIEVNGSVLANEMLDIHPEVSGRLTYLNISEGNTVKVGTILATINDADLQAQLNKSKVQLDLAKKTEDRLKKLLAINGVNQAEYDAALNSVNNIKADIELLKAQIDKTVIKAAYDGELGLRQVSPGAYVTPATVLATLQQINKLKIDFTVPDIYSNLIKKGNTVQVSTNQSASTFVATIIATEPVVNTSSRNLKVRAIMDNNKVNPGAFVKVLLKAEMNNNHIVIPTNAIIPDADSKKAIVVKDGKGKFVNIETGIRTAGGVEVVNGLNIGDTVVVTGVLFVRPNALVKIRAVKKLEEVTKE